MKTVNDTIKGRILLAGDVHGVLHSYAFDMVAEKLADWIGKTPDPINVILMGDVGLGFPNDPDGRESLDTLSRFGEDFGVEWWLIRGNHDNPSVWQNGDDHVHVHLLDQGYCVLNDKLAYILPGGLSVDKAMRVEGRDWWPGEEVVLEYLQNLDGVANEDSIWKQGIISDVVEVDIILSHTGPKPPSLPPLWQTCWKNVADEAAREQEVLSVAGRTLWPSKWYYAHFHTENLVRHTMLMGRPDAFNTKGYGIKECECNALPVGAVIDITAYTVETNTNN